MVAGTHAFGFAEFALAGALGAVVAGHRVAVVVVAVVTRGRQVGVLAHIYNLRVINQHIVFSSGM